MKLSIIVPLYNEGRLIDKVLNSVKGVELPSGITMEIIIVDDGSTDDSFEILDRHSGDSDIRIFHRDSNAGKASAVKLGIKNSSGEIILIQDADLEYDPACYPQLLEPIIKGKAQVVYGSRFKGRIRKMTLINRIANMISNFTLNLLYGAKISDVNTGYKLFRREVFDRVEITSRNFTFETEVTVKLLKLGYDIYEVPIDYDARLMKEGKKMTWLKALEMYWGIIKYRR